MGPDTACACAETGVDRFLPDRGLALTPGAYALFVDRVSGEFINAAKLLERRADGDYSADKRLQQFPELAEGPKHHKVTGLTPWSLFEVYVTTVQPQSSTVNRWRVVFLDLEKHFEGRPASAISEDDAQAWAVALVTGKRSAATVNDVWCVAGTPCLVGLLRPRKISSNPFKGAKVTQPRKVRTRETAEFSPEEASMILKATLGFPDIPEKPLMLHDVGCLGSVRTPERGPVR